MSLEVVYGETRNRAAAVQLAEELRAIVDNGTVYLGYPVLASADDRVYVDALLVSAEHGLVGFLLAEGQPASESDWDSYVEQQDRLFAVLESNLGRHESLRKGRRLAVQVHTVSVFALDVRPPESARDGLYCGLDDVAQRVSEFPPVELGLYRALQAALQRVTTIKPQKRRTQVSKPSSRGAIIKEIEKGIANLDLWQKRAAIETPEGPQRIRGLAGSGKTVVLALKAAYLHAQHPDWTIALTFYSRALYQQLEDLVTRFSFEHSNDAPDFERLRILHAWGSSWRDGVYNSIARAVGATPRDYSYALATYGRENTFAGVCSELLEMTMQSSDPPIFDAVLVDEAQDLPPAFFKLLYRFAREPKRIVWAFDELQKLSEAAMPTTDEMFGVSTSGGSLISLESGEGEARRDIVLPVCYRNTPWALTTAHALGFGIYRKEGLVQHFDDPTLWSDIGYQVDHGELEAGSEVELSRASTSYPEYFPRLISPDDAVVIKSFETEIEQDTWVAEQIVANLAVDELERDDILVVLPDAYTSKRRSSRFSRVLARYNIDSHLVGVSSSADQVFSQDSVAIAHIYRAKGNEAPMVYVLDAQRAAGVPNAVTNRNTLFTAITRSRAWVRICGAGESMDLITAEAQSVKDAQFHLRFKVPSVLELAQLRRVHRDRSQKEVKSLQKVTRSLELVIDALDRDEIDLTDLPPSLRTRLANWLSEEVLDEPFDH
jgi:superfamily I DNA and RNA helicase